MIFNTSTIFCHRFSARVSSQIPPPVYVLKFMLMRLKTIAIILKYQSDED